MSLVSEVEGRPLGMIYGLNSSGTCWLTRLVRLSLHMTGGDFIESRIVTEPFSPNAHQKEEIHPRVVAMMKGYDHLRGRWWGRNEEETEAHKEELAELFEAAFAIWPNMETFKTLDFTYWDTIRDHFTFDFIFWDFVPDHFSDVRMVRLSRGLEGWLTCIARKPCRLSWYEEPFYYPVEGETPWWTASKQVAKDHNLSEEETLLVRAGLFHEMVDAWWDVNEPDDVYHTTFEEIYANWDYEPNMILSHLGYEPLTVHELVEWAEVVKRNWSRSPFTRQEVRDLAALVRESMKTWRSEQNL